MPEITLPDAVEPTLDAPVWRVVVTDLAGNELGEIVDAHERKLHFALRSPETVSFKLNLNNAMLPVLMQAPYMHLFKVYKRTKLKMVAETTSWEFASSEDGITRCALVATSCFWPRLAARLIGKTREGVSADGDRIAFLAAQLAALNAIDDTGIRMGYQAAGSSIVMTHIRYKKFLEMVQELAFTVNGFDFYPTPVEPDTGIVANLNMAPWWGSNATDAIFEYGFGNNSLRDWGWLGDNSKRINTAVGIPASYPDNAALAPVEVTDSAGVAAVNMREEVVSTDLDDLALRALVCEEHVLIRKNVRQTFKFNPHFSDTTQRVPEFGEDFHIGDTLTGRINDNGFVALDGEVRCYGVDIDTSDEGQDTTSLVMVQEEAA